MMVNISKLIMLILEVRVFPSKNNSEIILNPFLDINSNFIVEEFNSQILTKNRIY